MSRFMRRFSVIKTYKYGMGKPGTFVDERVSQVIENEFPDMYEELTEYSKRGANVFEAIEILDEVTSETRLGDTFITQLEMNSIEYAFRQVQAKFSHVQVEPLSLSEAVGRLHLQTSAGYGFEGKLKGDVLDELKMQAKAMQLDIRLGRRVDPIPCKVGTRGVLHHCTSKKRRLIYIMPGCIQLMEQQFVGPILDQLKKEDGLLFFGDNLIPRLRAMMSLPHKKGLIAFRGDFEAFDRRVKEPVLQMAFDIVESMLIFDEYKGKKACPSVQAKWRKVFSFLKEYFLMTPIMGPDGKMRCFEGGIVSGSGFTQLIGSIVTALYVETACHFFGIGLDYLKTLGDDVFGILSQRADLEKMASFFERVFGAVLSTTKTKMYDASKPDKQFLGYRFSDGFLVRPSFEWFNLAMHPEKEVKDAVVSYSRLIAYMYLGGVNDVKFSRFFEMYQSGFGVPDSFLWLDRDMKSKMTYGGMDIEFKELSKYTRHDFIYGLTTYKY